MSTVPAGLLDGVPLVDVGAPGLVALAALLIFTGGLIPRSTHREWFADIVKERDFLREALREQQQITQELVVTAEVAARMMRTKADRQEA